MKFPNIPPETSKARALSTQAPKSDRKRDSRNHDTRGSSTVRRERSASEHDRVRSAVERATASTRSG